MAIKILLCYARRDGSMVAQLKDHLSLLEHHGLIALWDHGDIRPGAEWEQEMSKHFEEAQVILLLISASFIASKYYYRIEMQRAIERHERKGVCVIPVILRPVLWDKPPIDKLRPLPDAARPISRWNPRDEGFKNVAAGIENVAEQWNTQSFSGPLAVRVGLVANIDQLIAAVKAQIQPPGRATAMAGTLQQLSILTPNGVTLADLSVGWRLLAQSSQAMEDGATAQRRVTCGELAKLAAQITREQGDSARAIQTWQSWQEAFANSNDPRQAAMATTFARELSELQAFPR